MAGTDPSQRGNEARVSFGNPELDEMLAGGLMARRPYLIVGPSGVGKTTLALQFLCEGARRGEPALYVTVEDPPNEVRLNHPALRPYLDQVDVFDAIPDVMRYEHTPFKDIAAVRHVVPFRDIPDAIRQTPELSSVEVTGAALEQMLRSEVQKHGYRRLVVDSLTALQYFCMKGYDPMIGAQTFLRFLTDLKVTSLLTVEAPLEDVETTERMLARGEVRLFRWELDGLTVRAVGVEKFRGSTHDVRLHPYRIGPRGLDIQIASTISRDSRRIVPPAIEVALQPERPAAPASGPVESADPLSLSIQDLLTLKVDVAPLRTELQAALEAARSARREELDGRLARLAAMVVALTPPGLSPEAERSAPPALREALHRARTRADRARGGVPPMALPPTGELRHELERIVAILPLPPPVAEERPTPAPPPRQAAPAPVPPAAEPPPSRPAAPAPTPPAVTPAPARRIRSPVASKISEPPPLPTVLRLPTDSPPAAVTAPPLPPAPESAPTPAVPPTPTKAAPVRRARRTPAAKRPTVPVTGEGTGATAPGAEATDTKPRRRVVRRKKAPPVVSSAPVSAPAEATASSPTPPASESPTSAVDPSPPGAS